ncbi:MAG: VCBS repeat-containing protein [Polyangiales bacterium]
MSWVVLAGVAGCIPAPVLRPRDGGTEVAADDRAADVTEADTPHMMDIGAEDTTDAAVAPTMDVVDAGMTSKRDVLDEETAPTDVTDGGGADTCSGTISDADACVAATAPRLLSPLSGAISGSHRPLVRWERGNSGRAQTLRFCADRGCSRVLLTRALSAELSAEVLDVDLPRGPVFWRVETTDAHGATLTSATWEFFVSGRSTRSVFWYGVPDFDGDGVADLVVGAFGNASDLGRAYGYRGQSIASGTPTWTLRGGEEPEGLFGSFVQSVGDVNGDGFVDLGVSGLQESGRRGTVRVFLGSANGLPVTSTMLMEGTTEGELFGVPIAGIGDANGDGYADMAVGITGAMSGRGALRVYFGGPSGVTSSRSVLIQGPGSIDTQFGGAVAGVGDLDRDGVDDFVVGAPAINSDGGTAWLVRGSRALAEPIIPTELPGRLAGRFGASVSPAGDIDGNGYLEFAVGAPYAESRQGRVLIYTGTNDALPARVLSTIVPTGDLASLLGTTIAGGKDIDGDEYPDLVVGAPRQGFDRSGTVGFVLGGLSAPQLSTVSISRQPEARGSFGFVATLLGDTNADGLADFAVSAGNDLMLRPAVYLYRGAMTGIVGAGVSSIENPEPRPVIFGLSLAQ